MERNNYTSGAIWESEIGYSRAVKVNNAIEISGTTSILNGEVYAPYDCFRQCCRAYDIIESVLKEAGSCLQDVTRIRVFVTDISKWEEVAKAHAIYFKDIKPAMSLIGINALIDPALVVEIEASAIVTA